MAGRIAFRYEYRGPGKMLIAARRSLWTRQKCRIQANNLRKFAEQDHECALFSPIVLYNFCSEKLSNHKCPKTGHEEELQGWRRSTSWTALALSLLWKSIM